MGILKIEPAHGALSCDRCHGPFRSVATLDDGKRLYYWCDCDRLPGARA